MGNLLKSEMHKQSKCGQAWYGLQPASPLHRMQEMGQGWLLGAALLQRPHLVAVQQLLIKGLFNQDSQLVTVQVPHPILRPVLPVPLQVKCS